MSAALARITAVEASQQKWTLVRRIPWSGAMAAAQERANVPLLVQQVPLAVQEQPGHEPDKRFPKFVERKALTPWERDVVILKYLAKEPGSRTEDEIRSLARSFRHVRCFVHAGNQELVDIMSRVVLRTYRHGELANIPPGWKALVLKGQAELFSLPWPPPPPQAPPQAATARRPGSPDSSGSGARSGGEPPGSGASSAAGGDDGRPPEPAEDEEAQHLRAWLRRLRAGDEAAERCLGVDEEIDEDHEGVVCFELEARLDAPAEINYDPLAQRLRAYVASGQMQMIAFRTVTSMLIIVKTIEHIKQL